MGDAADYLDDAMIDARVAHDMGDCQYGCPWCMDVCRCQHDILDFERLGKNSRRVSGLLEVRQAAELNQPPAARTPCPRWAVA